MQQYSSLSLRQVIQLTLINIYTHHEGNQEAFDCKIWANMIPLVIHHPEDPKTKELFSQLERIQIDQFSPLFFMLKQSDIIELSIPEIYEIPVEESEKYTGACMKNLLEVRDFYTKNRIHKCFKGTKKAIQKYYEKLKKSFRIIKIDPSAAIRFSPIGKALNSIEIFLNEYNRSSSALFDCEWSNSADVERALNASSLLLKKLFWILSFALKKSEGMLYYYHLTSLYPSRDEAIKREQRNYLRHLLESRNKHLLTPLISKLTDVNQTLLEAKFSPTIALQIVKYILRKHLDIPKTEELPAEIKENPVVTSLDRELTEWLLERTRTHATEAQTYLKNQFLRLCPDLELEGASAPFLPEIPAIEDEILMGILTKAFNPSGGHEISLSECLVYLKTTIKRNTQMATTQDKKTLEELDTEQDKISNLRIEYFAVNTLRKRGIIKDRVDGELRATCRIEEEKEQELFFPILELVSIFTLLHHSLSLSDFYNQLIAQTLRARPSDTPSIRLIEDLDCADVDPQLQAEPKRKKKGRKPKKIARPAESPPVQESPPLSQREAGGGGGPAAEPSFEAWRPLQDHLISSRRRVIDSFDCPPAQRRQHNQRYHFDQLIHTLELMHSIKDLDKEEAKPLLLTLFPRAINSMYHILEQAADVFHDETGRPLSHDLHVRMHKKFAPEHAIFNLAFLNRYPYQLLERYSHSPYPIPTLLSTFLKLHTSLLTGTLPPQEIYDSLKDTIPRALASLFPDHEVPQFPAYPFSRVEKRPELSPEFKDRLEKTRHRLNKIREAIPNLARYVPYQPALFQDLLLHSDRLQASLDLFTRFPYQRYLFIHSSNLALGIQTLVELLCFARTNLRTHNLNEYKKEMQAPHLNLEEYQLGKALAYPFDQPAHMHRLPLLKHLEEHYRLSQLAEGDVSPPHTAILDQFERGLTTLEQLLSHLLGYSFTKQ